ncbi:MAG TPA: hypothetical protein VGP04_01685, partial [Pseudonocardiaceae bacterium]|nr:hypothetical protein [Pseudonocardiaceae bacterium]
MWVISELVGYGGGYAGSSATGRRGPIRPNFASPPPIHALRDLTATWRQPPDTAPQALPWRSDVV